MNKQLIAEASAVRAKMASRDGDFIAFGRKLKSLYDQAAKKRVSFPAVMAKAGLARRRTYALIGCISAIDRLDIDEGLAREIGWAKLYAITPRLAGDRDDNDYWLAQARDLSLQALNALLSDNSAAATKSVQLMFTPTERRDFDKILKPYAGKKPLNPQRRAKALLQILRERPAQPARRKAYA